MAVSGMAGVDLAVAQGGPDLLVSAEAASRGAWLGPSRSAEVMASSGGF